MTEDEIQARLDDWYKADQAVTKGQSYSIEGLSVSRVDASMISTKIAMYERKLQNKRRFKKSGTTVGKAVFR